MTDPTEQPRRERLAEIAAEFTTERSALEARHGQVWSSEELRISFEVIGFMAPLVAVRERATGKKGSLEFQHSPRFYFNWQED